MRLWTVFFGDSVPTFWSRMLRPGFRHVAAASYFADQERWVYFDPCRSGTVVEVLRPDEFAARFQNLMANSSHVLSIAARRERKRTAAVWFCVGAVKALLGINCRAMTPYGLFIDLINIGAENVERQVRCLDEGGGTTFPSHERNSRYSNGAGRRPRG